MLHLSHDWLPDPRVERAALTGRSYGHEVYFAGLPQRGPLMFGGLFDRVYALPFSARVNAGLPWYWGKLRRAFAKVLEEVRPDILHAHNVVAARLCHEAGLAYVFDDHDYLSESLKVGYRGKLSTRLKLILARVYLYGVWRRWEESVEGPVLTVSEPIAEVYRRGGRKASVVPNMPSRRELPSDFTQPSSQCLVSVYVGRDTVAWGSDMRDMRGLHDLFKDAAHGSFLVVGDSRLQTGGQLTSTGEVPASEVITTLMEGDVGLLPWRRHWFHRYCNPNKPYQYAHAGLLTLVTDDLKPVIDTLGPLCRPFKDYEELGAMLVELNEPTRLEELREGRSKIIGFAKGNLLWERYEHLVLDAYAKA